MDDKKKSDETISSRSYSGHESDRDANNFVNYYKGTAGTRLDNCQTCHTGGDVVKTDGKSYSIKNPCEYCHLRYFEKGSDYSSGYPTSDYKTLNQFGKDYYDKGRNISAFAKIDNLDSDGDGTINIEEIKANRLPGDPSSAEGQLQAPIKEITWEQLKKMPYHEQLMLLNTTKQQYDDYVAFGGVKIADFFTAAGIDLTGATGFTIIAPDGYQETFHFVDFDYLGTFPDGIFYRVPIDTQNPMNNFVNYSAACENLQIGSALTNLWMIVAYKRDGVDLEPAYMGTDGKIGGEGPFRVVRPQRSNAGGDAGKPFRPDRGSRSSNVSDGWDYISNSAYDHNAGKAVKGTCIIRIDPMPAGYEEYISSNAWKLISDKKIVIYGHNLQ